MKSKAINTKSYTCDQVHAYDDLISQSKCIFIHGTDAFQKNRCFRYIITHLLKINSSTQDNNLSTNKSSFDGINTFLFYGDDFSSEDKINSIIDALNMMSFDMTEKIISIRNFEQLGKEAANKIAKYTEVPNPTSKLIMVSGKVDGKISAYKTIKENSLHIETVEMKYPRDLSNWLNNYLRENQLKMNEHAKQYFSSIVELDTYTAYNEIKKLELYVGKGKEITLNDVKECTVSSKTNSVFDLIEAIGLKQKEKSLKIAENLINNEESVIMINSMLTNFFFTLFRLDALRRKGIPNGDLISQHMKDINPYFREKHITYLQTFDQSKIVSALKHIYICDCRAKLSMADEKVLIASLVAELFKT